MTGTEKCGNGEMLVIGCKFPVKRWVSSGDLVYSMVTIVNNIVYFKVGKRVDLNMLSPQRQQKKEVMWNDGYVN